jgi:hypothetical protein
VHEFKRITPDEAINHEWFDEIRNEKDVEMENSGAHSLKCKKRPTIDDLR